MTTEHRPRKNAQADAEAAFAEHREISKMVSDLQEWLDEPEECIHSWCDCLREQLEPFAAILEPHFDGEEASPLYRELPVEFPRFANQLDRLFEEHKTIVGDLKGILDGTRSGADPVQAQVRELTLRTKMLLFTLKRHESEENEILQKAYWDDLAAGD